MVTKQKLTLLRSASSSSAAAPSLRLSFGGGMNLVICFHNENIRLRILTNLRQRHKSVTPIRWIKYGSHLTLQNIQVETRIGLLQMWNFLLTRIAAQWNSWDKQNCRHLIKCLNIYIEKLINLDTILKEVFLHGESSPRHLNDTAAGKVRREECGVDGCRH